MRSLFFSALLGCLLYSPCSGDVITKDVTIADARKAMTAAGYSTTQMAIEPNNSKEELGFWIVDRGVLILTFSRDTQRIIGVSFYLCDERPKATRAEFNFEVASFDTSSGLMAIKTQARPQSGASDANKPSH